MRERMVTIVAPHPIFSPSGESRQNLSSNERKRLLVMCIATLRLVGVAPNAAHHHEHRESNVIFRPLVELLFSQVSMMPRKKECAELLSA